MLIDGLIVPGNSGSPVILPSGIKTRLNPKTNTFEFTDRTIEDYVIGIVSLGLGGGLTVTDSSDYIVELIDAELAASGDTMGWKQARSLSPVRALTVTLCQRSSRHNPSTSPTSLRRGSRGSRRTQGLRSRGRRVLEWRGEGLPGSYSQLARSRQRCYGRAADSGQLVTAVRLGRSLRPGDRRSALRVPCLWTAL